MSALDRQRPDLLVLAAPVDEGAGVPLLRQIRELHGAALPIVVVTSKERTDQIVEALEAGADDYIGKPVIPPARPDLLRMTRGPCRLDYRQQRLSV